jgi:V/A-type H+-transporting ATPase subunit D
MTLLPVAPTRSNLLQMKAKLTFAIEGFQILDKKREVLSVNLLSVVHEAEAMQKVVWAQFDKAYRNLERARLNMGQEGVEWAALAVNKSIEVEILNRGTMGVPLPHIKKFGEAPWISYSLGDTPVELDEAMAAFQNVLVNIPLLTELVTKVWRLARELKKTQRRVHALERVFIPNYQETIQFIENTLEENEREETFRLKWLKSNKKASMERNI